MSVVSLPATLAKLLDSPMSTVGPATHPNSSCNSCTSAEKPHELAVVELDVPAAVAIAVIALPVVILAHLTRAACLAAAALPIVAPRHEARVFVALADRRPVAAALVVVRAEAGVGRWLCFLRK